MSANEWLQFISPIAIIVIVSAVLASIPFNATNDTTVTLKPLWLKRTQWGLLGIIVFAWLLADGASHITSIPVVSVNMVAVSKFLLVPTLIVSGIIILKRLLQRNNCLTQLCILAKYYLSIIFVPLFKTISLLVLFVLHSNTSKSKQEHEENYASSDEEKAMLDNNINYRGEYCDKEKYNWYTD